MKRFLVVTDNLFVEFNTLKEKEVRKSNGRYA